MGGRGAECLPQRLSTGKFLATNWEKEVRKKGFKKMENVEENEKKWTGIEENEKKGKKERGKVKENQK